MLSNGILNNHFFSLLLTGPHSLPLCRRSYIVKGQMAWKLLRAMKILHLPRHGPTLSRVRKENLFTFCSNIFIFSSLSHTARHPFRSIFGFGQQVKLADVSCALFARQHRCEENCRPHISLPRVITSDGGIAGSRAFSLFYKLNICVTTNDPMNNKKIYIERRSQMKSSRKVIHLLVLCDFSVNPIALSRALGA